MVDEQLPDCHELIRMLEDHHWVVVAERKGFYARLQPNMQSEHSVVVPTDPDASDYTTLLLAAVQTLDAEHRDLWSHELQPKLSAIPKEGVSFLKEGRSRSAADEFPTGTEPATKLSEAGHRAHSDVTSRTKRS
jgi:hypothetical protein